MYFHWRSSGREQDANGQTPSEGINTPAPSETGSEENGESQPEGSQKVYETDEYVDTDGGSGIPDAVPEDPNAPELPAADPGGDTEAGAQLPSANESSSEAGNSQEGSSETVQKQYRRRNFPVTK